MDDAFDNLLNHEESCYQEGFREGEADANRKSYLDGFLFGIEKGTEKGHAMGALRSRALTWDVRLLQNMAESTEDKEHPLEATPNPSTSQIRP